MRATTATELNLRPEDTFEWDWLCTTLERNGWEPMGFGAWCSAAEWGGEDHAVQYCADGTISIGQWHNLDWESKTHRAFHWRALLKNSDGNPLDPWVIVESFKSGNPK